MRHFSHPKTLAIILIALHAIIIVTLSGCGQRGPLRLPEPAKLSAPLVPAPAPTEGAAK